MASQAQGAETSAKPVYTLHFSPFSLYSLMIRFSTEIGKKLNAESAPNVHIKLVNLDKLENLSEEYLTKVNSKGQVNLDCRLVKHKRANIDANRSHL